MEKQVKVIELIKHPIHKIEFEEELDEFLRSSIEGFAKVVLEDQELKIEDMAGFIEAQEKMLVKGFGTETTSRTIDEEVWRSSIEVSMECREGTREELEEGLQKIQKLKKHFGIEG